MPHFTDIASNHEKIIDRATFFHHFPDIASNFEKVIDRATFSRHFMDIASNFEKIIYRAVCFQYFMDIASNFKKDMASPPRGFCLCQVPSLVRLTSPTIVTFFVYQSKIDDISY